jgi:hypothetical protein
MSLDTQPMPVPAHPIKNPCERGHEAFLIIINHNTQLLTYYCTICCRQDCCPGHAGCKHETTQPMIKTSKGND